MKTANSLVLSLILIAISAVRAPADDFDWPARKPGQGDIAISSGGGGTQGMSMQMCIDATTDKDMMQAGMAMAKSLCPSQSTAREGDLIVINSTCEVAGMKFAGRTEISGDFQSEYTMRVKSDVTGGPQGATKTETVHTARWMSAVCTGGMEPGDVLMPGGMKMNMLKMMDMMKGAAGALKQLAPGKDTGR